MSFFSFLGSLLPTRLFADNTQTDQTDTADVTTDHNVTIMDQPDMDQSDIFPFFPRLPAELRHMIINEALCGHEEETHRVVLFDPLTSRISPTKELATLPSPILFVNTEFRSLALKLYTKVNVLDLGAPKDGQYGREGGWYLVPMDRSYLVYSRSICEQIEDEVENRGVRKGCLYINPVKDVFITGIIPRQVALTTGFENASSAPHQPWKIPRDFLTEKLHEDTRIRISTMRDLEWDLDARCLGCSTCMICGLKNSPCCLDNFFDEDQRGNGWVPFHDPDVFTGVTSFGFYLLTAWDDMQQFLCSLTDMGGKYYLEEWEEKYLEFDLEQLKE